MTYVFSNPPSAVDHVVSRQEHKRAVVGHQNEVRVELPPLLVDFKRRVNVAAVQIHLLRREPHELLRQRERVENKAQERLPLRVVLHRTRVRGEVGKRHDGGAADEDVEAVDGQDAVLGAPLPQLPPALVRRLAVLMNLNERLVAVPARRLRR